MKLLLDIRDDKANFVMELLRNLKFVKATKITSEKAEVVYGLIDAVNEVNEDQGHVTKLKPARDLLNDL